MAIRRISGGFGGVRQGLALALALPLLLSSSAAWSGPPQPEPSAPSRPGRLIVKYRPSVDACAHCLMAHAIPFAVVTGRASLDQLHQHLGVKSARPLFFDRHEISGGRHTAYEARLDTIRERFPARAQRAAAVAAPDLSGVYVLELPRGANAAEAAELYRTDPDVEYAHPDHQVEIDLTPNDPFYSSSGSWGNAYEDLWGLHTIEAGTAWDRSTGQGIVVAVVDTGVDPQHPDLAVNMWVNGGETANNGFDDDGNGFVDDYRGWDFDDNDNNPFDQHGHGTHVAGTVAAVGNNGTGVVGVAWGARIMAVKGLGANGSGFVSDLAEGIVYAAENGADVLNNSWGGAGISGVLVDAVNTARSLGAVVVASAGNSNAQVAFFQPAGISGVISVAATQVGDVRAGFSNKGPGLSVAAPGVDVLSLRGSVSAPVGGAVVAQSYLRLNGTSMASPHAAGVAALLLADQPGLSPDEVGWHLELNADQPGAPGYEGELWNPFFGWGRINADRVFDTPPVTTRISTSKGSFHSYAGSILPDVMHLDFEFTTLQPVGWTLSSPSWLAPDSGAGAGPAVVSVTLDATALAPGDHVGSVVLDVPAATDGGAQIDVTAHLHGDPRSGAEIEVANAPNSAIISPPVAASNGIQPLVFWSGYAPNPPNVYAARVDGAGNVDGPYDLTDAQPYRYKRDLAAASDGRDFLLVWSEEPLHSDPDRRTYVQGFRVSASGQAIDSEPFVIARYRLPDAAGVSSVDVAFDGSAYTVVWEIINAFTDVSKVFVRQVGTDGTLRGKRRKIYPKRSTTLPQSINPMLACAEGICLVAWKEADGQTSPVGKFIDKGRGVRLSGDQVLDDPARLLLTDLDSLTDVVTNGQEFLVYGLRVNLCAGPVLCGDDAIAARVTQTGTSLDPNGIRMNNAPSPETFLQVQGAAFDGTNYVTTFLAEDRRNSAGALMGYQIFANRLSPSGGVLDTEPHGLLISESGTAIWSSVSSTPTHTVVASQDGRTTQPEDFFGRWTGVYVQPILDHAATPALEQVAIGQIGDRDVNERTALAFQVMAPGLDPAATTFSAANVPDGAVFDAPTGMFRWMPAGDQAGTYDVVHFEASDGSSTVAEDITIQVIQSTVSASGTVRDPLGAAVPGVALKLSGVRPARTTFTDNTGTFRFDDLPPGRYRLRVTRPSTKEYRAAPNSIRFDLGVIDLKTLAFVATPK